MSELYVGDLLVNEAKQIRDKVDYFCKEIQDAEQGNRRSVKIDPELLAMIKYSYLTRVLKSLPLAIFNHDDETIIDLLQGCIDVIKGDYQ